MLSKNTRNRQIHAHTRTYTRIHAHSCTYTHIHVHTRTYTCGGFHPLDVPNINITHVHVRLL